jgi:hypothetical protein
VQAGLQRRTEENVPPIDATRDATAADIDAQLSVLLQSVEADRAHPRRATERSNDADPGATTRPAAATTRLRWPRRRAPKRERANGKRRTVARARAGAGVAPRTEPARISYVRDPAARVTVYYVSAATVMAAAWGFLCARLLT